MIKIKTLPPEKLHTCLDAKHVPWENSSQILKNTQRSLPKNTLQPRAMEALNLSLHIKTNGYNVFWCGEPNLGRYYILREFLNPYAKKENTPPDLLYVNNFTDQDKPKLIAVPAGQGRKLKKIIADALVNIRKKLTRQFETDDYSKQRGKLLNKFQDIRTKLLKKMNSIASAKNFKMDVDNNGLLNLYPVLEGTRISIEDYDKLDNSIRQELKILGDNLMHEMSGLMRQLSRADDSFKAAERSLDQKLAEQVLDNFFKPIIEKLLPPDTIDALKEHLIDLKIDILNNLDTFLPKDHLPNTTATNEIHTNLAGAEIDTFKYDINLFVDNSETIGAPIIFNDNPTYANLLGCVERESELGALITDFTLIKSGALHKANEGYLILHVEDILQYPNAWDGLLRYLRSGYARIEETSEHQENIKTKSIEPEALALNLKVILIGDEQLYETLLDGDERFSKLFKIKAHMAEYTERNASNIKAYLMRLARIVQETGLLQFDRSALAWLVDYGSSLIEDQQKLSLKFPLIRELMIEASAKAMMNSEEQVTNTILEKALEARIYRVNLVEDSFMEEYDRETIKVKTSGHEVGHVNGLSVTWYGDFEFGLPHQISCTVGVGHGGIIDLEREAKLGGPIHTKAMMILKSYLVDQFAQVKPIILTGSLCLEQSYAGIEGDSASGAELAALISALAKVPVRLDLAFTGAISQSGQIMAVGGVTQKIEGFFKVCARHGLTGTQGVIIPSDNVVHLMLSPRVRAAVGQGKFSIYPVKHIEQALEILTSMPTGKRRKNYTFPDNTLYQIVDKRLQELGYYAVQAYKKQKKA